MDHDGSEEHSLRRQVCQVAQVDEPPKKKSKLVKRSSKKNATSTSPKKKVKLVKTASQKLTSLLFQACVSDLCQDDVFEQIEFLVKEKGANCDIKDVNGKTALFYLANSKLEDKEKVLDAERQSKKTAQLLIDNSCDLAAVDNAGFTAAMEALGSMTNLAVAEFLLKAGCKVLCPPDLGPDMEPKDSLLHRVVNNMSGNEFKLTYVVQLLTKYKYDAEMKKMARHVDADGYTPLLKACQKSDPRQMHNERPSEFTTKEEEQAWDGRLNFFKFLITKHLSDVNAKVSENRFIPTKERYYLSSSDKRYKNFEYGGQTALCLLLSCDPKFDFIGTDKATSASLIISLLVQKGANIDYNDIKGNTPLGIAVNGGYTATVAYLVKHTKCDVNRPIKVDKGNGKKIEELSHNFFVRRHWNSDDSHNMMLTLIDCGIDVNARSQLDKHHHGTFLHMLLQNQSINNSDLVKIVDRLLSKTAFDFDAQDDKGRTVMHYAFRNSKSQLNDEFDLERKLLSRCSLKIKDNKQRTPLHYILKKKKERLRKKEEPLLILRFACQRANKSFIDEQDYEGKSIFHMAAEKGFLACISLMTENKNRADVDLKDNDGNSPLSLAVKNKHDSCALALIQSSASLQSDIVSVSQVEKARRKKERKEKLSKRNSQEKDDEDEFSNDKEQETWSLQALRNIKNVEAVSKEHLYKTALKFEMAETVQQILCAPSHKSGLTYKDKILMAMETGKFSIALQIIHTICADPKTATHITKSYEKSRNWLHLLPLSFTANPDGGYGSVIKIAQHLMSAGISSSAVDQYGCTPIQYAILNRHFQLADCLAENESGYNVKKQDKFGRGYLAALFWRIHSSGMNAAACEFLDKLIKLKINLDVLIDLPLNPDIIKIGKYKNDVSIDHDYWNSYPDSKTTALIAAITCTSFEGTVTHNLLVSGANPNTPDGNNVSPLMNAVMRNHPDYVRQLLKYDFDPKEVEEKKDNKEKKKKIKLKSLPESDESSEESDMEDKDIDKKSKEKKEPWDKAYKAVKKTSPVKLEQKDNDGRTALHYVASPSPLGTFDNGELIYVLVKAGAKLTLDKFGYTPLTLAAKTCGTNIIETFRQLGIGKHRSLNLQYNDSFPVDDGVNLAEKTDCLKDAEKVLRRHKSNMEVDDVYIHEVDEYCKVKDGELLKDKKMDVWYDVLMTKIDVDRYSLTRHKFYKLQLVYQPEKKLYILFTRWGPIGESGEFQHTPFHDEAAAVKEFAKIFREKSGNKWIDFKSYERKPQKYRLLEDVVRKAPPKQREIKLDLTTNISTALPQHLYSLIRKLMNPKMIELSMNSCAVDTASLPFGQLNKERLMQGKHLLERIHKCIEEVPISNRQEAVKHYEMIAELSNDYFHVIPQKKFSYEYCEPVDYSMIVAHIFSICNMLNYEIISKMLLAAMVNKTNIHPTDYVYSCLGCKIELMEQDDPMSQLILKYIALTSEPKVSRIYKLSREGEEERLKSTKIGNHLLLWHGTESSNILSILTRGLVVAPLMPEYTGWYTQKGIYCSDEFAKSTNYVDHTPGKSSFMLLCQVALGNCVQLGELSDKSKSEADQKPDEKVANSWLPRFEQDGVTFQWMVLNSGAKIPYAKNDTEESEEESEWCEREFFVKDPAQVCLRYLVEYCL